MTTEKSFSKANQDELTARTISDFGEQWTSFRDNPGYYGSEELLADIFGPLLSTAAVKNKLVADIGSGTGRIVNMLLDAGASRVYAIEPSAAFDVLKSNTRNREDRITYLQGPGEALPANLNLDLVVSIGVIHHIPNPSATLRAAFEALGAGGKMLIWVYGREGNESYLKLVEPLRKITKRLPHRALTWTCSLLNLALDLYIWLCRFFPLPMRSYMRNVLAQFPRTVRRLTIYDQLNPSYSKYYLEQEALQLLSDAGFRNVSAYHRHGYSWTVIGSRP